MIELYYGRLIKDEDNLSVISSTSPLPYSDELIQISEQEFSILQKQIEAIQLTKKQERIKAKKEEKLRLIEEQQQKELEALKVELVERNQIITIEEEDEN